MHKTVTYAFHGCHTRKKYTHENCLHMFRSLYYFLMQLLVKWFHPLPQEKISLCFAKLPLLLQNNAKHRKSFPEVMRKNMRNFCTRSASYVFLCYEYALWPSHELSVAGLRILSKVLRCRDMAAKRGTLEIYKKVIEFSKNFLCFICKYHY